MTSWVTVETVDGETRTFQGFDPADPPADVVERMARALCEPWEGTWQPGFANNFWLAVARAALRALADVPEVTP